MCVYLQKGEAHQNGIEMVLSRVKRAELFDKSPWGRFGEEALKIGEDGFCYSTNKFTYLQLLAINCVVLI